MDFPAEDIIFDCLLTPVGSEVPASVKDGGGTRGPRDLGDGWGPQRDMTVVWSESRGSKRIYSGLLNEDGQF